MLVNFWVFFYDCKVWKLINFQSLYFCSEKYIVKMNEEPCTVSINVSCQSLKLLQTLYESLNYPEILPI